MESNVKPIKPRTWSVLVTFETAPLLLEMVSKAAVTGPQAHLLAELYAEVKAAADQVRKGNEA